MFLATVLLAAVVAAKSFGRVVSFVFFFSIVPLTLPRNSYFWNSCCLANLWWERSKRVGPRRESSMPCSMVGGGACTNEDSSDSEWWMIKKSSTTDRLILTLRQSVIVVRPGGLCPMNCAFSERTFLLHQTSHSRMVLVRQDSTTVAVVHTYIRSMYVLVQYGRSDWYHERCPEMFELIYVSERCRCPLFSIFLCVFNEFELARYLC